MSLLVKGWGILNDAYNIFLMNIVNVILQNRFPHQYKGKENYASTAVFVGAVLGQISLGILADRLGRRLLMIISMSFLVIGGAMCASVPIINDDVDLFISMMVVSQFVLGYGIGGEYPLSATSSIEIANNAKEKGRNVSIIFSLQGIGQLAAAFAANILIQVLFHLLKIYDQWL